MTLRPIQGELEAKLIALVGKADSGILAQTVDTLKTTSELFDRLIEIKDFGSRAVSDHGFVIALHIVFRLVIAGIFAGSVYGDHSGMNTNLVIRAAIVFRMGKAVGQNFSDDRHGDFRYLSSLCADDFASPPDVFQYVILSRSEKIIDVILKQLHIKESELFVRRKYGGFQRDGMRASEKVLPRIVEVVAIDKPIPLQDDRASISSLRYSSDGNGFLPKRFDSILIDLFRDAVEGDFSHFSRYSFETKKFFSSSGVTSRSSSEVRR